MDSALRVLSKAPWHIVHPHPQPMRTTGSGNVFLSFYGDILLGDLGISRELEAQISKVNTQLGTPPYMSPERIAGEAYGMGCDIWAIGILLFELMALYKPFDGPTLLAVAQRVQTGNPTRLARKGMDACGHSDELKELASATGLLHPQSTQRTSLTAILERYPPSVQDDADGEQQASCIRLTQLDGPLCPASTRRAQQVAPHKAVPKRRAVARGLMPSDVSTRTVGDIQLSSPSVSWQWPTGGSSTSESTANVCVPPECPVLPAVFEPRPQLSEQLLAHLREVHKTLATPPAAAGPDRAPRRALPRCIDGATVAFGMGGTGKSIAVAGLLRSPAVAEMYSRLCWIPVGQRPDLRRLLRLLEAQLRGDSAPSEDDAYASEALASIKQRVSSAATAACPALVVLDDVWDPVIARALGEPLGTSAALVITTRVHHLLPPPAAHMHCGLLAEGDALRLLWRCAGLSAPALDDASRAALEVVELCGRLPLAVAIAGAMMQERADDWQTMLVPLLRGGNRAALRKRSLELGDSDSDGSDSDSDSGARLGNVEDRVVGASLTLLRAGKQHRAVVLYLMLGAFPGEAAVPAAVLDALEPLFARLVASDRTARKTGGGITLGEGDNCGSEADGDGAAGGYARRGVKVLLGLSLLQGSIKDGVAMHGLLRAYAISQVPRATMLQLQGAILETLCGRVELKDSSQASANASNKTLLKYMRAHLGHHAACAVETLQDGECEPPTLDLHHPVLQLAVEHSSDWVRLSVAAGIGAGRLRSVALEAASEERWLLAGQVWSLMSGVEVDEQQATCRLEAWQALRRVHPVSLASLELEASTIKGLVLRGGLRINSSEHQEAGRRLDELFHTPPGRSSEVLKTVRSITQGAFTYARLHALTSAQCTEGLLDTYITLIPTSGLVSTLSHLGTSALAARAGGALNSLSLSSTLLHADPAYSYEGDFGANGEALRSLCAWYEHEIHHADLKRSTGRDVLCSGIGGALLLLRWGAFAEATASWEAARAAWSSITANVHQEKATWRTYRIDLIDQRSARAIAMAAGRQADAMALFTCSPEGEYFAALRQLDGGATTADDAQAVGHTLMGKDPVEQRRRTLSALEGHVAALQQYMEHWGMACTWTAQSFALMARAVGMLLVPPVPWEALHASGAYSVAWLPTPDELIALAATERAWDVYMSGAQHPSLACALLYARLGKWAEAQQVAHGLVDCLKQPLARIEAHRLLARCATAMGNSSEASTAWLCVAASEAAAAGYQWLELSVAREIAVLDGCDADGVVQVLMAREGVSAEAVSAFVESLHEPNPEGRA